MRRLYFTVTNDLRYDQRMIRICGTLADAGYQVTLVGRKLPHSVDLIPQPFAQKRLYCFFTKGKLFYAEYNFRLLLFLLFRRMDLICAIDLDTIVPCYLVSRLKRIPRVYDAHELFCEMKEIVNRPAIYRVWKAIERRLVPHFRHGYTVNEQIAAEFERMYGVKYQTVRNLPQLRALAGPSEAGAGGYSLRQQNHFISDTSNSVPGSGASVQQRADHGVSDAYRQQPYLLYQGAVNEGRCFETLIPAMQHVGARLEVCGTGNFFEQAKALAERFGVEQKLIFRGAVEPERLWDFTVHARAGITLFENSSRSNYLSLANRFFDYIQAGIPQLCVNYPAYREINDQYRVALLIDVPDTESITAALNRLLSDHALYAELQQNCLAAREALNWQQEKKKLLQFYSEIIPLG